MKPKIFKTIALTLACLIAVSQSGFSQGSPAPTPPVPPLARDSNPQNLDSKEYNKKMQKLHEEMRDLQKQMSDLNRDQIKKQALAMADLSKKMKTYNQTFTFNMNDKFSSLSPRFNMDSHFNFNFQNEDDKLLQEKVQTGEVKEKVKTFSKSYPADRNDVLKIENKYGKVTVNTWNKNEFKVDVQIKTYANEESEAQKLLDYINIEDHKDGDVVSFRTQINNLSGNNSWGLWKSGEGKTHVRKMEINYTVYMPSKNSVDISNSFGATELPDMEGKVTLHCSYGSLVAKVLSNTANVITVKYGSANIQELIGSDLDVAYGSLILGTGEKLNADVSYGPAKIGKIRSSANINSKYGGVQIADLDKDIKNLAVNCEFGSLKLGLAENTNADFDVTVRYGSFNYRDLPVNLTVKAPEDERGFTPTKTYKGHVGKGNANKVIVIKSSYGSVKFE